MEGARGDVSVSTPLCDYVAQGRHSNNEINVTYPKSDDVPRQKHGINRNTLSERTVRNVEVDDDQATVKQT